MTDHIDSVYVEIRSGSTVRTTTVVPKSTAAGVAMSYEVGQDVADVPEILFVRTVPIGFTVALTAHGKAPDLDAAIELTRARIETAGYALARLLDEACRGPHEFVQHRDRKPPWCPACRYTETGERA